ncbi:hypothetical protein JCM12298_27210 [Desulfothermus naphthae]
MRKTVWDSMLDADLNERYWTYLAKRYHDRDKWAKIFLAIMTSGTVASWGFWSQIEILWKILSAISALLAIALPILNWPKMVESMIDLKQKWFQIKSDYEILWLEIKDGINDENKVKKELKKLKEKEARISQKEANLPNDKKLLQRCRNEVLKSRGLLS